jgi:hypothetical protein
MNAVPRRAEGMSLASAFMLTVIRDEEWYQAGDHRG